MRIFVIVLLIKFFCKMVLFVLNLILGVLFIVGNFIVCFFFFIIDKEYLYF